MCVCVFVGTNVKDSFPHMFFLSLSFSLDAKEMGREKM